jgi:hypothetical protein
MTRTTRLRLLGFVLSVLLAVFVGMSLRSRGRDSRADLIRPTPNVLVAVQALARLETVSFHMERVMDLSDKQSRMFGLIESEDALLLVAVANVTAGVDLTKMRMDAVEVDHALRKVRIVLPKAEVFSTTLDNEHTYVHTRRTGLMAQRKEDLEARARVEAERALLEAARSAGILQAASKNAQRSVESLLRSLEFQQIEVIISGDHHPDSRPLTPLSQ